MHAGVSLLMTIYSFLLDVVKRCFVASKQCVVEIYCDFFTLTGCREGCRVKEKGMDKILSIPFS